MKLSREDILDSKSFKSLPPLMKEAVTDFFSLLEKDSKPFIEKFERAVDKVADFHNINTQQLYDYFDRELEEQLGE